MSSGVSLAMGAVAEEMKALLIFSGNGTDAGWRQGDDAQCAVRFSQHHNECEAVMASLLAIKYWKGQFTTVAGINPDYSVRAQQHGGVSGAAEKIQGRCRRLSAATVAGNRNART